MNESLSEQLTAMGIQNVIYSFSLQYPSIFFPGETQQEASDRKPPAGIHIKATINSVNPFTWWDTARKIAAEKPDMIVVRFWLPFMAPALGSILKQLRKRLKVPVVGLLDNVVPHEKRMGDKRLTRFFLDQCDAFVVMSSTVMKELSQFDTQKPRALLYHPIYDHFGEKVDKLAARKHLSLASDAKVILFFGIIRKYKGLKLLLEAISKMPDKHRLKLVVAGEFYGDRAIYTRLIEKLKLQGNVVVNAGFVDKYKVKFYFCAADIVAQPYLSATQSGVTQIAYHFETPMLVTNVGGLPEMVAHNKVGYVCAPDRDDIARSLSAYFNEDRYEEFCSNIREEKKRFSWEHFANGIVSLAMSV